MGPSFAATGAERVESGRRIEKCCPRVRRIRKVSRSPMSGAAVVTEENILLRQLFRSFLFLSALFIDRLNIQPRRARGTKPCAGGRTIAEVTPVFSSWICERDQERKENAPADTVGVPTRRELPGRRRRRRLGRRVPRGYCWRARLDVGRAASSTRAQCRKNGGMH